MANELTEVTFKAMSGLDVHLTSDVVINYLTKGNGKITNGEIAMFLNTCKALKLNPLENGDVHLIKYGDQPAQIVVGYMSYIKRANAFPDYRGFKAGVVVVRSAPNGPVIDRREGSACYPMIGEQLIGGWCRVFRQREGYLDETYQEVSLAEYTGRTKDGKPNSQWASKPGTMIQKTAISQTFRLAYPEHYSGIYTDTEMEASGFIQEPNNVVAEAKVVEVKKASQDQRKALFEASKHLGERGVDVVAKVMKDLGYANTSEIPADTIGSITDTILNMTEEDAIELLGAA